jgi:ABC-type sugar transport system permease subunit
MPSSPNNRNDRITIDTVIERKRRFKEGIFPYMMVMPAVILFTFFAVYPFILGIKISFFRWDGLSSMRFVGMRNYLNVFRDYDYWIAIKHTFLYAFFVTAGKNVAGFLLAHLMLKLVRAKGFFRTIVYMPVTFSYVICGILWSWIFNPNFGLLNNFLSLIGLESMIRGWLSDFRIAIYSIMVVDIWRWSGFHMVLYLAGLQAIPKDYYEAAEIDGAGAFRKFISVTVPQLNSVIVLNVLMALTGALVSNFDIVNVMTNGGPFGSTEVALTYIYRNAFEFYNLGKASAMSVILFAMTFVLGVVQILSMTRDENYDN